MKKGFMWAAAIRVSLVLLAALPPDNKKKVQNVIANVSVPIQYEVVSFFFILLAA